MKKIIYSTVFVFFGIITLESFQDGLMKKDGAAPGYTGSPGDTLKNCTACHGGTAVNAEGWITSNIPASGYIPNQTYTITATNKEDGATRFGFEVSPQDIKGALLGKMAIKDPLRTKFVGQGDKYITYTENGVEGKNSLSWTFDWVAPPAGTGEVIFYGGFNSNFEGHKDGDKTYLSTLKVMEKTNSLQPSSSPVFGFTTYPNPANQVLNVKFAIKKSTNLIIDIVDVTGKQVAVIMNEKTYGEVTKQLNTSFLPNGNYLIRLETNGSSIPKKIVIAH